MNKAKILIIEDDTPIADLLSYGLSMEGFETRTTANGAAGMVELQQFQPNLLLLDWMLPDQSGLDICKQVTASYNIPILMITAKSDITDKILGLEFGADDYITKPFDLREVIARIRTILRRVDQANNGKNTESKVIRFKQIEIIVEEHLVKQNGIPIDLTPKEFDLLMTLINHRGKTFTRSELLDIVWGYDFVGDTRTVDTHIQRLRKKLDASDLITTVFGIGYKFEK
ncbi:winged helix-turn-helix domain-containing protein [Paenibacillus polymyxa]|mgnify:CR=1 FL=1|uniref:Winged helix family two component transcriptional regulator n=1 Tax=Paenibacillus polymyxa TaxID=1406 RepID=A0A0F0FXJ6_PAEPO|nr:MULTISPECIES: response regulator transcription factor [Paenibacillus]AHM66054.1 sensory transduction protein RegX3 [Paenibacillus polymyxa SQR-21]AIY11738.1 XRE family transcriptional regulator [Paenibacillus polymyxa]KAE8558103.1 DNA-binding response regulator [Paenibacillus polymyxa]KAF6583012.1 response regulator transcription factor [Paenibacillus sp. EKM211P]KAF6614663.1 response regulator transcription factor [Paenibacillus sp. EKM101P]